MKGNCFVDIGVCPTCPNVEKAIYNPIYQLCIILTQLNSDILSTFTQSQMKDIVQNVHNKIDGDQVNLQ